MPTATYCCSCNGDGVGQNLYMMMGGSDYPPVNMQSVTESWYSEISDYDYQTTSCTAGRMCGHYTQVGSWTYLGCVCGGGVLGAGGGGGGGAGGGGGGGGVEGLRGALN